MKIRSDPTRKQLFQSDPISIFLFRSRNESDRIRIRFGSDLHTSNVDHIIKKASKKLYLLRVLRRAGFEKDNIQKVYSTTVRPMLEYAVPVWQAIPDYLSEAIEVVQERSLKIIYPECDSYTDALNLADLPTLKRIEEIYCARNIWTK